MDNPVLLIFVGFIIALVIFRPAPTQIMVLPSETPRGDSAGCLFWAICAAVLFMVLLVLISS